MTRAKACTILAAAAALVVACSPAESKDPPRSSNPSGATPIPGGPMEPTPTAASPKVPGSQQEAQDAALQYLQRTVDGLPPGTTLDSTDARGGANLSCDDNYSGPDSGPTEYIVATHVVGPTALKPTDLIARTGDLLAQLGFHRDATGRLREAQPIRLPARRIPRPNRSRLPRRLPPNTHRHLALLPRCTPSGQPANPPSDPPNHPRELTYPIH